MVMTDRNKNIAKLGGTQPILLRSLLENLFVVNPVRCQLHTTTQSIRRDLRFIGENDVLTPKWLKQPWIFVRAIVNVLSTRAISGEFMSKFLSVEIEAAATCNAVRVSLQALGE